MFGPQRRIRICGRPEGVRWQDRGGGAMSPILLNSPSRSTFPQVFELSYDAESSRGRDPAETSATALQPSSEVQDLREGYVGVQADVIGYN